MLSTTSQLLRVGLTVYIGLTAITLALPNSNPVQCHTQQADYGYNLVPSIRDCATLANDMRNGPKSHSIQKFSADPNVGNFHLPHAFTLGGDCHFIIDQTNQARALRHIELFSQYELALEGIRLAHYCFSTEFDPMKPRNVVASTYLDKESLSFLIVAGLKKPKTPSLEATPGFEPNTTAVADPANIIAIPSPQLAADSSAIADEAAAPAPASIDRNVTTTSPSTATTTTQLPPLLTTGFVPGPVPQHIHCWSPQSSYVSPDILLPVSYHGCSMAINRMLLEPLWDRNRIYTKQNPFHLPKYWRPKGSPCVIRLSTDIGTPDRVQDIFSLADVFSHVWWVLKNCDAGFGGRSKLGRGKGFEVMVLGVNPAESWGVEMVNGTGGAEE